MGVGVWDDTWPASGKSASLGVGSGMENAAVWALPDSSTAPFQPQ